MTLRKVLHILIVMLVLAGVILATQLTGCGGNARRARQWLEAGQRAYNVDSTYTAIVNLQRALDEATKAGDEEVKFEATVYLAMLHAQLGQDDKSYQMLRNLPYVEATTRPQAFSSQYYLRLLGRYYATVTHNYDSAIYYGQRAIELDRRLYADNATFELTDMANLAETYLARGDTAQAWAIVRQVEAAPKPSFQIYLSQIYYIHSLLSANRDTAYHYARLGEQYAIETKSDEMQIACLRRLCELDSLRYGLPAPYVEHKHRADSSIRRMQGSEVAYKVAALQEQHKIERMQQQSRNDHIFGTLLSVVLLLALATALTLMRLFKRDAQAKQQLADATVQREKLEKELLQLRMKKNEERLEQAHKENVSMTELITEMQRTLTDDDDQSLLALETTMKTQHADFLKRVTQQYPELTENDIRLIGFIKMGVKPKVMAMALNISMKSLNSARYRLRKRMKLDNEVNLNDFIHSI